MPLNMAYNQRYRKGKTMALGNVNGADIKSQIQSIAKSSDAGSRKGRIEILEKVSELGKEILDALNVKDEQLVELEGGYNDMLAEFENLDNEIKAQENKMNGITDGISNIDAEIAELQAKSESEGGLDELDQSRLDYLINLRSGQQSEAEGAGNTVNDLSGKRSDVSGKLDNYTALLDDIAQTMEGYADAGAEVKDAAHRFGRSGMADNIEKNGGAIKRNESMWGKDALFGVAGTAAGFVLGGYIGAALGATGGIIAGETTKNDTERYVERMGYRGMEDGGNGYNMTYHDDTNGGYHAAYDVIQYGIGGKLRQLTAQTLSYGQTDITAANDMKSRAEAYDSKRKPLDDDGGTSAGTA